MDANTTLIILAVIAAIAPTIAAITAMRASNQSKKQSEINTAKLTGVESQVETVHKLINSGLTVRLAESKELGKLEGKEEQREEDKKEAGVEELGDNGGKNIK